MVPVPIELVGLALLHVLALLAAVVIRKPALVRRDGEWFFRFTAVSIGALVDRPRTTRPTGQGGGRQTGGRWASRASMAATYLVPLGTRDRGQAEELVKYVTGEKEGPLPTPKLEIARELYAGRFPA